ncbi:transcription factor E2F5 [Uranotaenia lowii]|uniref:transcription factor E2F5 n=1 Tax=Uranotaenia lowii TaxID=190385 RepID=UPI00247845CA|nr:transcription factor E2F5 [Uranotaenia lowii]
MSTKLQRGSSQGGKKRNQQPKQRQQKQQQLTTTEEDLDGNGKRLEKSLATMTVNVVDLLKRAPQGILNLGDATKLLQVRQKRRIYDVTNVLEGIGLIEKSGKNSVKWRGAVPDARKTKRAIRVLKHERTNLLQYEARIDQYLKLISQSTQNSKSNESDSSYAYVTSNDLVDVFGLHSTNVVIKKDPKLIQGSVALKKGTRTLNVSSDDRHPLDVILLREPHGACFTRPSRKVNIDRRRRSQLKLEGNDLRDSTSAMQQLNVSKNQTEQSGPRIQQDNLEGNSYSELQDEKDLTRCSQFQPNPWAGPDLDSDSPFIPLETSGLLSYNVSLDPREGIFNLFDLDYPSVRGSESRDCNSHTDVPGIGAQLGEI